MRPGTFAAAVALAAILAAAVPAAAQQSVGPSGLPLPRFVSTKSAPVNVRQGPSKDHEVAWTFVKAGVPVEVTQEFDVWYHIRDSEGAEGWVQKTLLSGKRTALVAPWEKSGTTPVREKAEAEARIIARIEPNVLVEVMECTGHWCRIGVEGVRGWLQQGRIWGAYPGEIFR